MSRLDELVNLLNKNYLNHYQTVIIGGFDEPFYRASRGGQWAQIQFTQDYIRSAFHELAHWCVAGCERRKLDDYGYWYAADGRNQVQQDAFFQVELKPQAIEWAFSIIAGVKFEASVDNLGSVVHNVAQFNHNLQDELNRLSQHGFTNRVTEILHLLAQWQNILQPITYIHRQIQQK